ncbi:MAG: M56 family metallopeptidase [Trebonia sp.]
MTAAVIFVAYAAAAGLLAPTVLRGRWAMSSPRLAMSMWLALQASWVVAVVLALLAATAPSRLTWLGPVPGGAAVALAGLLLSAAVVLRAGWCLAGELARSRRERREHAVLVAANGRPGPEPGVAILDDDAPAAYCMPCGRYRVVISAGALAVLGTEQLRAVLAHERAHLRSRHHLLLSVAAALARAFPRVPLFAQAEPELRRLAEMAADDAAARRQGRDQLAKALVILSKAAARPAALAAGGPAAVARIQRLLDPPRPRQARRARLAVAVGLLLPAAVACLPLIMAACDVTRSPLGPGRRRTGRGGVTADGMLVMCTPKRPRPGAPPGDTADAARSPRRPARAIWRPGQDNHAVSRPTSQRAAVCGWADAKRCLSQDRTPEVSDRLAVGSARSPLRGGRLSRAAARAWRDCSGGGPASLLAGTAAPGGQEPEGCGSGAAPGGSRVGAGRGWDGAHRVGRPGGGDGSEVGVAGQLAPGGQVDRRGRAEGDQVDRRAGGQPGDARPLFQQQPYARAVAAVDDDGIAGWRGHAGAWLCLCTGACPGPVTR